jgi:vitamin B12 transporter
MRFGLVCLFFFSGVIARGQLKFVGRVLSVKGVAVPGASVSVKNSYDGGTSDSSGYYSFVTDYSKSLTLVVSAIGFKEFERVIQLDTVKVGLDSLIRFPFDITLREATVELNEVVVTLGSFDASDKKIGSTLNFIDVTTTAGANADVVQALNSLPGTQKVGEKEGLFVRGGDGSETKIFIDGTLVSRFFYSGVPGVSQRARFAPYLFKGTVFATGAYSAEYGQALSSVLSLNSQDLGEKSEAYFSATSTGFSAGFQKLSKTEKFCYGGNYNYANLKPYMAAVAQDPIYDVAPTAQSIEAFFRLKTSKTGLVKFYVYYSSNKMGNQPLDIDSLGLKNPYFIKNINLFASLSFRERITKKTLIRLELGSSYNKDHVRSSLTNLNGQVISIGSFPFNIKQYEQVDDDYLSHIKAVFETEISGLGKIKNGTEFIRNRLLSSRALPALNSKWSLRDDYFAAFSEGELKPAKGLSIKPGIRYEQSSFLNQQLKQISIRFAAAYRIGSNLQVSTAYGQFLQRPTNEQLLTYKSGTVDFQQSTHAIFNIQTIRNERKIRLEAYYKDYAKLTQLDRSLSSPLVDSIFSGGSGYAKGIDIFFRDRKSFKNFDYWISYSFVDAKRRYLQFVDKVVPPFVSKHNISVVLKKLTPSIKSQINLTYNYSSSRTSYFSDWDQNTNRYVVRNAEVVPELVNFNLSFTYLPMLNKINANKFIACVFSVTNIFNQRQVYSYQYSFDGKTRRTVGPTAGRFFFIGFYLNLGVDRTKEILENIQ